MLKDSFCSSPWFHLRLTYNGDFEECRWYKQKTDPVNIKTHTVMEFYNSDRMRQLRTDLLNGKTPEGCSNCYYEDSFNKLSGRQRQLLKSGIQLNNFALSTRTSPHYENFEYSFTNNGRADYYPTDLQIDLGNTCNSACIMCTPFASSKLEQDYKKLYKISSLFEEPKSYTSWTRDPDTLTRVVDQINSIPNLKYIHFLGGETLYDPAFYDVCERLVHSGRAQDIIVGTTTNGTLYDARIEHLIKQFKEFHLGISIESVTELNDYIRYPGKINEIKANIAKFLSLRKDSKLYVSLRITPNVFTVSEIDKMFEYMIEHNVIAESCSILTRPASMQIQLMPDTIRQNTLSKLNNLIDKYQLEKTDHINIRRADLINDVIANVIIDYRNFVRDYAQLDNADQLRTQLVEFIKAFESLRNNSIIDYVPDYADFLRHYGY